MSTATYGRVTITKTNKGYEVYGKVYPTLTAATDAVDKRAKTSKRRRANFID